MQLLRTSQRADRRALILLSMAALALATVLAARALGGQVAPALDPGDGRARSFAPPTTAETVERLRETVAANPGDAAAFAQLGLALLQQARETADPAFYLQAETALNEATALEPGQLDALVGQGALALARHDFSAGLEWGRRAQAIMPYRADAQGIIVDALVELGRYPEAVEAVQRLVDLRPELASYSRVSYVRELHGNVDGAVVAMQAAVDAGPPGSEALAWTLVQLGNLHVQRGDLDQAERAYREALAGRPGYAFAEGGLARVLAARGDTGPAIASLQPVVARLPLPEFIILLGDLYTISGQPERAREQYELVRAIQQLNAGAGMNTDLEMALFEANHGDPARALALALAAREVRPTIYADDVVAWAALKTGDCDSAARHSEAALRLGTQDALLFYHAGRIAASCGRPDEGRDLLARALSLNPAFDFVQAREAREILASLEN